MQDPNSLTRDTYRDIDECVSRITTFSQIAPYKPVQEAIQCLFFGARDGYSFNLEQVESGKPPVGEDVAGIKNYDSQIHQTRKEELLRELEMICWAAEVIGTATDIGSDKSAGLERETSGTNVFKYRIIYGRTNDLGKHYMKLGDILLRIPPAYSKEQSNFNGLLAIDIYSISREADAAQNILQNRINNTVDDERYEERLKQELAHLESRIKRGFTESEWFEMIRKDRKLFSILHSQIGYGLNHHIIRSSDIMSSNFFRLDLNQTNSGGETEPIHLHLNAVSLEKLAVQDIAKWLNETGRYMGKFVADRFNPRGIGEIRSLKFIPHGVDYHDVQGFLVGLKERLDRRA